MHKYGTVRKDGYCWGELIRYTNQGRSKRYKALKQAFKGKERMRTKQLINRELNDC